MNSQRLSLDRFIRRLYVRLVIVRAIERAGLCAAVSGAMVLTGSIVLMCRGEDALALSAAALLVGAFAGLSWGLCRRPQLIDAAMQADRQLEMADLLATAWSARDSADPWAAAVVALAGQRCAGLNASQVVMSRYGSRVWGGIGLSAALVLTIGLTSNLLSHEGALARDGNTQLPNSPAIPVRSPEAAQPEREQTAPSYPSSSHDARDNEGDSTESREFDLTAASARAADEQADHAGDQRRESPSAGQSRGSTHAPAGRADLTSADAPGRNADPGAFQPAGGGQPGALSSKALDSSASGTTASQGMRPMERAAEPEVTGPSIGDKEAAMARVKSGKIPSDARDVVEEYFRH